MDQIIQEGGLEYATDVIIHLQQISIDGIMSTIILFSCRLAFHLITCSNIPALNYAYVNIYHWRKSLSGKNVHKNLLPQFHIFQNGGNH